MKLLLRLPVPRSSHRTSHSGCLAINTQTGLALVAGGCDGSSGVAGWVAGDRYPTAHMAALDSVRRDKIQLMAPLVWVHDRWTTSIADSYRFFCAYSYAARGF
ncbi:MAG: hypothetical protein QOE20_5354 [Mycobacterium sp.]|nr:hypothetical protein [Mycobacterium sp.]